MVKALPAIQSSHLAERDGLFFISQGEMTTIRRSGAPVFFTMAILAQDAVSFAKWQFLRSTAHQCFASACRVFQSLVGQTFLSAAQPGQTGMSAPPEPSQEKRTDDHSPAHRRDGRSALGPPRARRRGDAAAHVVSGGTPARRVDPG